MNRIVISFSRLNKIYHHDLINIGKRCLENSFIHKAVKFRKWQDVQASILGKLILKNELNQLFNIQDPDIQFSQYGKPFVQKNEKVNFNISHSANIVVVAISDTNTIGIDIEHIDALQINSFKNQFTPYEWTEITTSPNPTHTFYCKWTQKEAILKAIGKGLYHSPNSFEIKNNHTLLENQNWYVNPLHIHKDYFCNIACNTALSHCIIEKKENLLTTLLTLFNKK